jgi:transcriptional regulator NrdR family protein
MKCPVCGAQSDVKETRSKGGYTYRRRVCFNYHTFTTEERAVVYIRGKNGRIAERKFYSGTANIPSL